MPHCRREPFEQWQQPAMEDRRGCEGLSFHRQGNLPRVRPPGLVANCGAIMAASTARRFPGRKRLLKNEGEVARVAPEEDLGRDGIKIPG